MTNITGTSAAETLNGTDDDDLIRCMGGTDTVFAGSGNDTIFAGSAYVYDGVGSDVCVSSYVYADVTDPTSADLYIGYGNGGIVDYSAAQQRLVVDLGNGTAEGAEIGADTLKGVRYVRTGLGDDLGIGSDRTDVFYDAGGENEFFGRGGRDYFLAQGESNNRLVGGSGPDAFLLGTGSNSINAGSGNDSVHTSSDSILGPEIIGGEAFVLAGDGDDDLSLKADIAKLYGGAGDDVIRSNNGDSTMSGGAGNDTIQAFGNNDLIAGGAGADVFWFQSYGSGTDVVLDFEDGIDKISPFGIGNAPDYILSVAHDTKNGVMLSFWPEQGTILIRGIKLAQLDASDFLDLHY
jgi:Ca2+-binding RTX toxin-like protein